MQLFSTMYTHLFSQPFYCFISLYNMFYFFSQYISYFILLPRMFYSFPSMSTCFLICFMALMLLAQPTRARICLNTLFVLRSTCLCASCHACAQIYMFMCLKLCLDAMPGALQLCFSCLCLFLVFGFWVGCRSTSSGLGLHPYIQVSIKDLDFFSSLLVYAMFALFHVLCLDPCLFAQIQALCHFLAYFPFCGFIACWSLGPLACLVAFDPFGGLFGCNHVWGVHLSDVWHVCCIPFSSLLSLRVRFLMLTVLCAL